MLTIIAPMESEISYLRQNSTLRRWYGDKVNVLMVGVGKEAVRSSLSRWLGAPNSGSAYGSTTIRPDRILLLGFCGAVDPALARGDLVVSGRYYLDWDTTKEVGKDFFEADSSMLEQAVAVASATGLAWRGVESLTVSRPVATREEKTAIHRRQSVSAVNMEDYWVAEFAAQAEIPFLAVRAVIDTAGQSIPRYAMGLQEHRWNALASAATRPWQLPNLVSLASNLRVAQRSLRRFAVAFLQSPDSFEVGKNLQRVGTS